jgi:uncharacterized protein YsxB (DUF464 family)
VIVCDVAEANGRIRRFAVRGHAGYAEAGSDIVCAAVSALVTNAVNSCEHLLRVVPECEDDGHVLRCSIPLEPEPAGVDLLFRSMVFGLQQIAKEYPEYVKVRVHQEQG